MSIVALLSQVSPKVLESMLIAPSTLELFNLAAGGVNKVSGWQTQNLENLSIDIEQIIDEGISNPKLDIDRNWNFISYIFSGQTTTRSIPYLVERSDDEIRINPIFSGSELDEFTRYLEGNKVKEIADALFEFLKTFSCKDFIEPLMSDRNSILSGGRMI